jgi:hypothetical protein
LTPSMQSLLHLSNPNSAWSESPLRCQHKPLPHATTLHTPLIALHGAWCAGDEPPFEAAVAAGIVPLLVRALQPHG